jgi:hypothetical protein
MPGHDCQRLKVTLQVKKETEVKMTGTTGREKTCFLRKERREVTTGVGQDNEKS